MTVLVITNCPMNLRGDLTKWFLEINAGVYVGNISARVRDELWERIISNVKTGRATMVFRADNEQKIDFKIHNTPWIPIDYDGLKLILHPNSNYREQFLKKEKTHFSKAAKYRKTKQTLRKRENITLEEYCIVDIETTGIDSNKDSIIEMAALYVVNDKVESEFHSFINTKKSVPQKIQQLTGITDNDLKEGKDLRDALKDLKRFVGKRTLVFHNAAFDLGFLSAGFNSCGLSDWENPIQDTYIMAKRKIKEVPNYKLPTLADALGCKVLKEHRALSDCYTTFGIYTKLKEM